MSTIFTIIHIVICFLMIVVILMQSGKQAGLSGSIAGGAETFFGRSKGRTIDKMLSKWTSVISIAFLITAIVLALVLK